MKFKRITAKTKLTFPCLLAYNWAKQTGGYGWTIQVYERSAQVEVWGIDGYTHWMPFEWPEVRGE